MNLVLIFNMCPPYKSFTLSLKTTFQRRLDRAHDKLNVKQRQCAKHYNLNKWYEKTLEDQPLALHTHRCLFIWRRVGAVKPPESTHDRRPGHLSSTYWSVHSPVSTAVYIPSLRTPFMLMPKLCLQNKVDKVLEICHSDGSTVSLSYVLKTCRI